MASCDIFLASEDATFAMPEINVGLAGGVSMLRTMVGRSFTRRMFFTGMKVSAAELYRRGVIDEVVPTEQLMPLAMEIAQEIASKAPLAIAYAKQAANMMDLMPQRDGYRFEQNFTMALARTEDAQEARKAFLEKRKPVYKGR
jgi:enoyl-CoA hydratase